MFREFVGAAVLAVIWPLPSAANSIDTRFLNCDGFDVPTKDTDGMSVPRSLLSQGSTKSLSAADYALGRQGSVACDYALADPSLLPAFWQRRAHLLQAKALHEVAQENFDKALSLLAESDALGAGRGDRWFDDSIVVGNALIRGLALYSSGRKIDAIRSINATVAARPYALSIVSLAGALEISLDPGSADVAALMTRSATLQPELIESLLWLSVMQDDFAGTDRWAAQLRFDLPRGHGGWRESEEDFALEVMPKRAKISGALAYAKLALGKREESARVIADAELDIAEASAPPQPGPNGKQPSKREIGAYEVRKAVARRATFALEVWKRAITLRDAVAGKSFATASMILAQQNTKDILPIVDILLHVQPVDDAERAALSTLIEQMRSAKDKMRSDMLTLTTEELRRRLPTPESERMHPTNQSERWDIMGKGNGYAVIPDNETGLTTIRYGSVNAPRAMIEEAAMLKAARFVRDQGNDAFILVSTRSIQRSTTVVTYAFNLRQSDDTKDSGFEARFIIRPVNTRALPPDLQGQRWRLINADAVIARLSPKFAAVAGK